MPKPTEKGTEPYILHSSSDTAEPKPIDPKATLMTIAEVNKSRDPNLAKAILNGSIQVVTDEQRNEFKATQEAAQQQEQDAASKRLQNDIKAAAADLERSAFDRVFDAITEDRD